MDEALKKALSEGIGHLSFKKKDGTIRGRPKGTKNNTNNSIIV